jgi:hypothetical protein
MVEALIFWGLALYGAMMAVWQVVQRLQRRLGSPHPVTLVLVVQNAEHQIEGMLRMLLLRTAWTGRERRVLVLDVGSCDDTPQILERLTTEYTSLRSTRVASEEELHRELHRACLEEPFVGCIYDLRLHRTSSDITADMIRFCH